MLAWPAELMQGSRNSSWVMGQSRSAKVNTTWSALALVSACSQPACAQQGRWGQQRDLAKQSSAQRTQQARARPEGVLNRKSSAAAAGCLGSGEALAPGPLQLGARLARGRGVW